MACSLLQQVVTLKQNTPKAKVPPELLKIVSSTKYTKYPGLSELGYHAGNALFLGTGKIVIHPYYWATSCMDSVVILKWL